LAVNIDEMFLCYWRLAVILSVWAARIAILGRTCAFLDNNEACQFGSSTLNNLNFQKKWVSIEQRKERFLKVMALKMLSPKYESSFL
jgi:hypothetical protein